MDSNWPSRTFRRSAAVFMARPPPCRQLARLGTPSDGRRRDRHPSVAPIETTLSERALTPRARLAILTPPSPRIREEPLDGPSAAVVAARSPVGVLGSRFERAH